MWHVPLTVVVSGGVALAAGWLVLRRRLLVVEVEGISMTPTLRHGDRVLALRRPGDGPLRRGQIVVCHPPAQPDASAPAERFLFVKRVTGLAGEQVPPADGAGLIPAGHVWVRGDGPMTYDSATFGPLPVTDVVARVVARLAASRGTPVPDA